MGFSQTEVYVLDADTGKSAWLGPKFRTDLNRLFDHVGGREIGLVVAADVARLFRDASLQVPTQFAGLMQRNSTSLLTTHGGTWYLLDLRTPQDFETFIDWCRGAANHRRQLRGQMMAAREQIVITGAWSGRNFPIGWRVDQKRTSLSAKQECSVLVEYPPHRNVLFSWLTLAAQPGITTQRDLCRTIRSFGLALPPFDPDLVDVAYQFQRSCLLKARVYEHGTFHDLRSDEPYYPSEHVVLKSILEPLIVGDLLFGRGEAERASCASGSGSPKLRTR